MTKAIIVLLNLLENMSSWIVKFNSQHDNSLKRALIKELELLYLEFMNIKTSNLNTIKNAFEPLENTNASIHPAFKESNTHHRPTQSLNHQTSPTASIHLLNGNKNAYSDDSWAVRSDLTSDPFDLAGNVCGSDSNHKKESPNIHYSERSIDNIDELEESMNMFSVNESVLSEGGLYSIKEASMEESLEGSKSLENNRQALSPKITTKSCMIDENLAPTDERLSIYHPPKNIYIAITETPTSSRDGYSSKSPSTEDIKNRNFECEFSLEANRCENDMKGMNESEIDSKVVVCEDLRRLSIDSSEQSATSSGGRDLGPVDTNSSSFDELSGGNSTNDKEHADQVKDEIIYGKTIYDNAKFQKPCLNVLQTIESENEPSQQEQNKNLKILKATEELLSTE